MRYCSIEARDREGQPVVERTVIFATIICSHTSNPTVGRFVWNGQAYSLVGASKQRRQEVRQATQHDQCARRDAQPARVTIGARWHPQRWTTGSDDCHDQGRQPGTSRGTRWA